MKKYFTGILAIVLAVGAAAFTAPSKASTVDPVYDWLIYNASGSPTGMYLEDKTEAQVRAANQQCNGTQTTCFEAYNQAHTASLGILIQKP